MDKIDKLTKDQRDGAEKAAQLASETAKVVGDLTGAPYVLVMIFGGVERGAVVSGVYGTEDPVQVQRMLSRAAESVLADGVEHWYGKQGRTV